MILLLFAMVIGVSDCPKDRRWKPQGHFVVYNLINHSNRQFAGNDVIEACLAGPGVSLPGCEAFDYDDDCDVDMIDYMAYQRTMSVLLENLPP